MRLLIRALLVVILLVAGGFLLLGYWAGHRGSTAQSSASPAIGTSGRIDTTKARERGAEIGEKTAVAAAKVQDTVSEAAISTKIKAKMALDETVKARSIDVSTSHSVVTLSGTVASGAERDRAVALARETAGVTEVVDHLTVAR
jgi:hyperosmotically inducible protein